MATTKISELPAAQNVGWVDGTAGGVIKAPNGAVGGPAFSFQTDPDCGMYRIGANNYGFAVQGFAAITIDNTWANFAGVGINGTGGPITNYRAANFNRTTDVNLSVNSVDGGPASLVTHTGAAGEVIFTLPSTIWAGTGYSFVVNTAQYLQVKANTGFVIYNGTSVSASAGYIRSNAKGSTLTIVLGNTNEWYVMAITGTWTVDS